MNKIQSDWGVSMNNWLINCSHILNEVRLRLRDTGQTNRELKILGIRERLNSFIDDPDK